MIITMNKPSTYKRGTSLTGHKVHAVSPGTTYRPNPHVRIAQSLCGQRVFPEFETFDPRGPKSCERCQNSIRVLRGRGA